MDNYCHFSSAVVQLMEDVGSKCGKWGSMIGRAFCINVF